MFKKEETKPFLSTVRWTPWYYPFETYPQAQSCWGSIGSSTEALKDHQKVPQSVSCSVSN